MAIGKEAFNSANGIFDLVIASRVTETGRYVLKVPRTGKFLEFERRMVHYRSPRYPALHIG